MREKPTYRVRFIRSRDEYDQACARLDNLSRQQLSHGSAEDDEFEILKLMIERYEAAHIATWPLNPVDAIRFRMSEAGLTNKDLVPFIGSISRVSDVLAGRRELTLQMIRRLHKGLGIPLKSLVGSEEIGNIENPEGLTLDYSKFPLAEMAERRMFEEEFVSKDDLRSKAQPLVEAWIRRAAVEPRSRALLRAPLYESGSKTMDDYALMVWRIRVVCKARGRAPRAKYKEGVITREWLRAVAQLSVFDEGPKLAQEYLSRHGVCLVFERHFKQTYLDGAAMLDGEIPIVALTLRHDRLDNFWFTLMHELVHVGKHLSTTHLFIADNFEDKSRKGRSEEDEADEGAQEALIPVASWTNAKVRETQLAKDAIELAKEVGIHPAIVAGRLRRETGNWRLLHGLIADYGSVRRHFEDQLQ